MPVTPSGDPRKDPMGPAGSGATAWFSIGVLAFVVAAFFMTCGYQATRSGFGPSMMAGGILFLFCAAAHSCVNAVIVIGMLAQEQWRKASILAGLSLIVLLPAILMLVFA